MTDDQANTLAAKAIEGGATDSQATIAAALKATSNPVNGYLAALAIFIHAHPG